MTSQPDPHNLSHPMAGEPATGCPAQRPAPLAEPHRSDGSGAGPAAGRRLTITHTDGDLERGWSAVEVDALSELERDALDELVHEVASNQASDAVNNNEQVDFLLAAGWSLREIRARVTR